MNCRSCAYPLWNLGTHVCPECGTPFSPAEFEFLPCSVRFCCPQCDQSYFGTDPRGLLLPRTFPCVKCDAALTLDAMIVRPLREGEVTNNSPISMPWFERERRGTVRAWFATIGPAMTRPGPLIDAVPEDASASGAVGFMAMTIAIFTIVSGVPMSLFSGLVFNRMMGQGGSSRIDYILMQAAGYCSLVVSLIVAALIWAVVLHGILRMVGGATKPLLRTLHAISYSAPAAVLMAVPCGCPGVLGGIWWIISGLRMTARVHRCDGGRVAVAGIAALIVALAPVVAVQAAMIMWSQRVAMRMTFAGTGGIAGAVIAAGRVGPALRALADRTGAWPAHGLELWFDGVTSAEFAALSTSPSTARAGSSLRFRDLERNPNSTARLIEYEAARLPPTTIAHRVGDVIFTYHGIDPASSASELWIAVIPGAPGVSGVGSDWIVVQLDGGSLAVRGTSESVRSAIDQQNRLRTAEGLAPLPADLSSLTVDAAAVR